MPATITPIDRGSGTADNPYEVAGIVNTNFANVNTALAVIEGGYIGQNYNGGSSYELVLADAGKIIGVTHTSEIVVTIPANSAVSFPINTRIDIYLDTDTWGGLEIAITDDTLLGLPALLNASKGRCLSLWKKSATVWYVFGGTEESGAGGG